MELAVLVDMRDFRLEEPVLCLDFEHQPRVELVDWAGGGLPEGGRRQPSSVLRPLAAWHPNPNYPSCPIGNTKHVT